VVVRLKGLAILVPGDAEADILARYPLPDVDALVVSHHGSEGAVTVPVLDRLTPSVSVVPVGAGNTFGHPSAATVRLLGEWGTALLRTDDSGWVALRPTNGAAVDVVAER
jgi:competence protein ComEC